MSSRLLFVCIALYILCNPGRVSAQFTDPHSYDNTPVGVNQLEVAYAYAHSNASIDTSLIVSGAQFNLNAGSITFTRYFGLARRLVWAEASLPLGGLAGSVNGTDIHGSVTGAGDSSYTVSALLKGGPAMSVEQFENYTPGTTLGMSFSVTAPTGSYNPNKLLNLGSDRWSFKPELALSHPFGAEHKWQVDAYANAQFFTDNTTYRGKEVLRQQPLPGFEGHVSYSFLNNLWASLDTRFCFRGDTAVNGVPQNNSQQSFILGSEASVSLSSSHALVFEFAKALLHQNSPIYTGLAVKYTYSWGGDHR
jgi:hypothetical protein